jgi:hypothetical protein
MTSQIRLFDGRLDYGFILGTAILYVFFMMIGYFSNKDPELSNQKSTKNIGTKPIEKINIQGAESQKDFDEVVQTERAYQSDERVSDSERCKPDTQDTDSANVESKEYSQDAEIY